MIMLPCAEIELFKCIAGLCHQPTLLELKDTNKVHFSCSLLSAVLSAATLKGKKVLAGIKLSCLLLFTGPGAATVKGKKVVAGIVSFDFKPPGIGMVFARVSSVVPWIKKNSDAGMYDCWKKGK